MHVCVYKNINPKIEYFWINKQFGLYKLFSVMPFCPVTHYDHPIM